MKETDQRIDDLLLDWEAGRLEGQEISVEELCIDSPELAGRVAAKIAVLKQLSWMGDPDEIVAPNPVAVTQPDEETDATRYGPYG